MSDFVTVEAYLHKYKMEALEAALDEDGIDIDDYMQDCLIDLYAEMVPEEIQQEIRERIDAERTAKSLKSAEQHTAPASEELVLPAGPSM